MSLSFARYVQFWEDTNSQKQDKIILIITLRMNYFLKNDTRLHTMQRIKDKNKTFVVCICFSVLKNAELLKIISLHILYFGLQEKS